MGIKWSDIKIGISPLTNKLYIGKTRRDKDGYELWTDKSPDMTDSMIRFVKEHLKERCREEEFKDGIYLNFKDGTLSFEPKKEEV